MARSDDRQEMQTALALHQKGRLYEAAKLYRAIIETNPNNFNAVHFLGIVEAGIGNIEQAKLLMARSLSVRPPNIQFIENYAAVLFQSKDYKTALKICQEGLRLSGGNASLLYVSAISLFKLSQLQESADRFDKLILLQPNNALALNERASVLGEMKRYDDALASVEKALSVDPQYAEAQLNKGNLCSKLKRYEEAFAAYDKALALNSGLDLAWLGRGNVLNARKCHDNALIAYYKAIALKPDLSTAWLGRGNAFFELKRYDEASAAYDKALALDPDLAKGWLGRGNVLFDLKRHDEAFAAYDQALTREPDLASAWLGRGNVFKELKRYDEALAAYDKALAFAPDLENAWLGRGHVFDRLNRHEEAAIAYAKVLAIDPLHPFTKGLLLHQKMLACEWTGLGWLIEDIDSDIASGRRSAEPFGYQAVARSALQFKFCAELFAAERFPRSQIPLWHGERYAHAKIRVGYLSGEFRDHVTSFLMAEMFELHDKNRFEIFAFDNGEDDGGDYRARINKAFDEIIDISRLDDLRAAAAIKDRQIDILVNLNGYHGEPRNLVFSCKPAPVQVNYLGFTATMGADYIDYIIADEYVIPAEHRAFYTESVVYLPDTYQANDTKRPIAERPPTRAEVKLPDTGFVFCCFNNSFKITPEMFDLWMRLLEKIDHSVLWLSEGNSAVSRNLRETAKRRNIAPERLVFAPPAKYSNYLARYNVADLFLDTSPFNAGATASDALWVGLPVLTCSGQPFTARMAGSLLNAVGLPELIATTLGDYERIAIHLATHPEKLALIRQKLADNRLTTPLFDTKRFTKNIEAAYTAMYERHQAGLAPDHIAIAGSTATP